VAVVGTKNRNKKQKIEISVVHIMKEKKILTGIVVGND
jgi:hypothetical protein